MLIKFRFTVHSGDNTSAVAKTMAEAFGPLGEDTLDRLCAYYGEGHPGREKIITCTPEQFCVFLISRDNNGLRNNWKTLNVKAIYENSYNTFDFSRLPLNWQ